MGERALLASRSGPLSPWFEDAVEGLGYYVCAVVTVQAPEDGQYNVPPSVVDSLSERVREADVALVAVDDLLHPGQAADLRAALSPSPVWDRREVVWERLAGDGNAAAEACLDLRRARVERREAERAQRTAADADPTGVSGSVSDLDRRCQRLRDRIEGTARDQHERVERGYEGVDTRVVVTGPATAEAAEVRAEFPWTGAENGASFRPARPVTDVVSLGPCEAAVTRAPGLVEQFPDWYAEAVPGTVAALARAETIVVAGASPDSTLELAETLAGRFDAESCLAAVPGGAETVPSAIDGVVDPADVVAELAAGLPTTVVELSVPYVDDAHELVSELHDAGGVESVEYGETIRVRAAVPNDGLEALCRRVEKLGIESDVEPFRRVDGPEES